MHFLSKHFLSEARSLFVLCLVLLAACNQPQDALNSQAYRATITCPTAATLTPIYTLQGEGLSTPLEGQAVTTQGVVVGDFQESNQLRGFFLQDTKGDNKPSTSDGIFVYTPSGYAVNVGDYIQISGTVSEFSDQTQLDNITSLELCSTGVKLRNTNIKLPVMDSNSLESYEGMLVKFSQTLTVTEVFNLGRFGELGLAATGRLYHPNNGNNIGESATKNSLRRILLDDGSTRQNPNPIPYLSSSDTSGTRRVGDKIPNLTGVLSYGFDAYRIQPTQAPEYRTYARPVAPKNVGGNLKVASFNVLNYFTSLDSRGANSEEEFERQEAKILEALATIDADVVGLIEIENNGNDAVNNLVAALNTKLGATTYAAIQTGTVGSDEIKVALIYKPSVLTPEGNFLIDDNEIYSRPPIAQTFKQVSSSKTFSVVVNHFKSKGCGDATGEELDEGQGCWNALRTRQATQLLNFVEILGSTDPDVLVLGDLNSYANEDPISTLESGGLSNLLLRVPKTQRYSYVFDGESGTLDYALASPSLNAQVKGATIWHINADEPLSLDYNLEFKTDDRYAATPFRSSDHDPVIVGLDLE
ncbi:MAG: ExeM/NucH family extracellular endonuclease [Trueperaceae bacterium]